jgi:hypothetical protein
MAKGCFLMRAEVPNAADRAAFDDWYATDHLPWATQTLGAQRGWRCWSQTEPAVHYAFYEFADVGEARALIDSEKIKQLIADFDRVWGNRVSRQREIVQDMASQPPAADGPRLAIITIPRYRHHRLIPSLASIRWGP